MLKMYLLPPLHLSTFRALALARTVLPDLQSWEVRTLDFSFLWLCCAVEKGCLIVPTDKSNL